MRRSLRRERPAWLHGLLNDTIEWRSHHLRVLDGTLLERPVEEALPLIEGAIEG